jgi:uncharacterized protein (TIGR03083 family)
VRALRADGEALAAAAENNLDQPVPTCPGWTIADLVQHTGWVHRHKSAAVRRGGIEPADVQYWEQPTPPAKSLLDWYREGLADLVDVLGSSDPEAPAHSWAGDHRVAFWQRRMAQETLVHRYDAEAAAQEFTSIDAALAADGVDEFLRIFVPANDEAYPGPHGVIVVAPDDGGAGWSVALGDEPVISSGATTPADATLRAVTADVLLVLWRRKQPDAVRVDGDQELVRSFLAWSDLD